MSFGSTDGSQGRLPPAPVVSRVRRRTDDQRIHQAETAGEGCTKRSQELPGGLRRPSSPGSANPPTGPSPSFAATPPSRPGGSSFLEPS